MTKNQIYKICVTLATAIVTCVAIALGLRSRKNTKTISTKSEYRQKAHTSIVIQTNTIVTKKKKKKM